MAWITKNIYVSGFTLYVGPYRRVGTTDTDRAVNLAIKQHLIAALLQGESTSKAASVRDLLLQIENLDKKLAKRIVAAVKQNVLQLRHVEYYVKIAQRPDTRNPSACVQKVFWVHIAERFPHQEARITIETQVDPYIN